MLLVCHLCPSASCTQRARVHTDAHRASQNWVAGSAWHQLVFEYPAKAAKHREQAVAEDRVCAVVRSLRRRDGDRLLVYRSGRQWHNVSAADINAYLSEISGGDLATRGHAERAVVKLLTDHSRLGGRQRG